MVVGVVVENPIKNFISERECFRIFRQVSSSRGWGLRTDNRFGMKVKPQFVFISQWMDGLECPFYILYSGWDWGPLVCRIIYLHFTSKETDRQTNSRLSYKAKEFVARKWASSNWGYRSINDVVQISTRGKDVSRKWFVLQQVFWITNIMTTRLNGTGGEKGPVMEFNRIIKKRRRRLRQWN